MEFLEVFLVFCLIFSKKENKIKNLYVSMQWFLGGPFLWASLFLVYINHLGKELSSSVKLFANNTFVSSITHAINTSADQKSENLTIINTWVTITHSKQAQKATFGRKKRRTHAPLYFNNAKVSQNTFQKYFHYTRHSIYISRALTNDIR